MNIWRMLFLSGLYVGKIPFAPGTMGSVLGVVIGLPILYYSQHTLLLFSMLVAIIAVREITIWEEKAGIHDEKWIVIDEIVGVWVAIGLVGLSVCGVVLAFVLFRVFDVWKPSIIGRIDTNVKGGLGVVGDDVLAGIVAGLLGLAMLGSAQRLGIAII